MDPIFRAQTHAPPTPGWQELLGTQDSCMSWEWNMSQQITCRPENCPPPSLPMQVHKTVNFSSLLGSSDLLWDTETTKWVVIWMAEVTFLKATSFLCKHNDQVITQYLDSKTENETETQRTCLCLSSFCKRDKKPTQSRSCWYVPLTDT